MPQRFGESAAKEQRAKAMLREGGQTYKQIAAAVGTSKSQVQRFADELREAVPVADVELPYEPPGTPTWRPSATAVELLEERARALERMNAQLISDEMVLVRRLREPCAQCGGRRQEEQA